MPGQKLEGDSFKSSFDGSHLGQHVNAVLIVLDHLLEASDLALDSPQPGLYGSTPPAELCHTSSIPPWGIE